MCMLSEYTATFIGCRWRKMPDGVVMTTPNHNTPY